MSPSNQPGRTRMPQDGKKTNQKIAGSFHRENKSSTSRCLHGRTSIRSGPSQAVLKEGTVARKKTRRGKPPLPTKNAVLAGRKVDQGFEVSARLMGICFVQDEDTLVLQGHRGNVRKLEWNPSSSILASVAEDNTCRLWPIPQNFRAFASIKPSFRPLPVCISCRGWASNGREQQFFLREARWNSQGSMLVTGDADGVVRIWDATGNLLSVIDGPSVLSPVSLMIWSATKDYLVVGYEDGYVRLLEGQTGGMKEIFKHSDQVIDGDWNGDESFVTCAHNGGVLEYSCSSAIKWVVKPRKATVPCVRYKGRNKLAEHRNKDISQKTAASSEDNLLIGTSGTTAIRVSPHDQNIHVSIGTGPTVHVWDSHLKKKVKELRGHRYPVCVAEFSRNGKMLATGAENGLILIRDAINWNVIARFSTGSTVRAVSWNANDAMLAVAFDSPRVVVLRITRKDFRKDRSHAERYIYN